MLVDVLGPSAVWGCLLYDAASADQQCEPVVDEVVIGGIEQ